MTTHTDEKAPGRDAVPEQPVSGDRNITTKQPAPDQPAATPTGGQDMNAELGDLVVSKPEPAATGPNDVDPGKAAEAAKPPTTPENVQPTGTPDNAKLTKRGLLSHLGPHGNRHDAATGRHDGTEPTNEPPHDFGKLPGPVAPDAATRRTDDRMPDEKHRDAPEPAAAVPWVDTRLKTKKQYGEATEAVLQLIDAVRSRLPSWQDRVDQTGKLTSGEAPDADAILRNLTATAAERPKTCAKAFFARDTESTRRALPTAQELVGPHANSAFDHLRDANGMCDAAVRDVKHGEFAKAASKLRSASEDLTRVRVHTAYLMFVKAALDGGVGEETAIDEFCAGWGLTSAHIDELWGWLRGDLLPEQKQALAIDQQRRSVYRKDDNPAHRILLALTPLWGAALTFGVVSGLFGILDWANVTEFPGRWAPSMVALLTFVVLGALLHLGSRMVNINYDNPIRVMDAGGIRDWLALRWLGVLTMYVPVVIVVASMWGAGKAPKTFAELGTALLAGYSADSFLRAAVSRMRTQSTEQEKRWKSAVAEKKPKPSSAARPCEP